MITRYANDPILTEPKISELRLIFTKKIVIRSGIPALLNYIPRKK